MKLVRSLALRRTLFVGTNIQNEQAMRRTYARGFLRRPGVAFALMLSIGTAAAQDYPSRPVTAIVPFAGGSASDVVSRIMFATVVRSLPTAAAIASWVI